MIGPLSLSPTRIFLIACFIPSLFRWAAGEAGRIRVPDILVLGYAIWCCIALMVNHRMEGIQPTGILFIETMGPYLLARLYIRDKTSFTNTIRLGALLILLILPFSIYEWLTGKKIILETIHSIATTFEYSESEIRMGLRRVQGTFEHPILYGLFCASFFSLLALSGNAANKRKRVFLSASTLFASVLSMSSAPIGSGLMQLALVGWHKLMHSFAFKWKLLWLAALLGYLIIEFGSNQTLTQFYISKFTFDQQTGWYRFAIWEFGTATVANHPLLGIGLNDWVRPSWMVFTTVDNFWLLTAMRYGLPALIMLALAILVISLTIARRMGTDTALDSYRTGYLICMFTFAFVGSTVHLWGPVYLWYLFLLGSGIWMMDASSANETSGSHRMTARQAISSRRHANEAYGTREDRPGRRATGSIERDFR